MKFFIKIYTYLLFICLYTPCHLLAEDVPPPSLDAVNVCKFTLAYQDKGSGGDKDIAIYTPRIPPGYFMIGGYAQGNYNRPDQCVIAVKPANISGKSSLLLSEPATWNLVWADNGSGANMDGSIWQAVSSNPDYYCVGSVGQTGYHPPLISNFRCVHKCLLQSISIPGYIWSDRGTNADKPVSMYKLANSNSFFAIPNRTKPSLLLDLQPYLTCDNNLDAIVGSNTPVENISPPPPPPEKATDWVNPDEVHETQPRPNSDWVNPDNL